MDAQTRPFKAPGNWIQFWDCKLNMVTYMRKGCKNINEMEEYHWMHQGHKQMTLINRYRDSEFVKKKLGL